MARIQWPEILHSHGFAVSSANYRISANCVKSLYLSYSTSHKVPIDKKVEHAIYSSRREYFNSMDNFISTQRSKKPLDFEIDSRFSANYDSPSSANYNFSANCIFRISESTAKIFCRQRKHTQIFRENTKI